MEIIEVKCVKCKKEIYVTPEFLERHNREKLFCTLGCLPGYTEELGARYIK